MDVMFGQDGLRLSILRARYSPITMKPRLIWTRISICLWTILFSILISTVMRIVLPKDRTAQRTVVDHEKSEAGIRCGQTHLFRLVCSGLYEKQRQYLARFFETRQLPAFADYLPISVMPTQRQACLSMPSLLQRAEYAASWNSCLWLPGTTTLGPFIVNNLGSKLRQTHPETRIIFGENASGLHSGLYHGQ